MSFPTDAFSKPEPYGIMMRKDDPAFKKVVDAATAALYQSADGQKLYDKWFMQKIPPKGLNLNTPIGAELKTRICQAFRFPGSGFLQGDVKRTLVAGRCMASAQLDVRIAL